MSNLPAMNDQSKMSLVLNALALSLFVLALAFLIDLWGKPGEFAEIPLVDPVFTSPATLRVAAEEVFRLGDDTSDFACNACHDLGKPPELNFDEDHNILVSYMHEDIVLAHGRQKRNNNCFNCHDENNLEMLQTRDGRELPIWQSAELCGSCHGPTYRDWEAGVHGRTSGFWHLDFGERHRKTCTACHDPHNPSIPSREPAPGPFIRFPAIEQRSGGKDH
jgi:hypothetical protein